MATAELDQNPPRINIRCWWRSWCVMLLMMMLSVIVLILSRIVVVLLSGIIIRLTRHIILVMVSLSNMRLSSIPIQHKNEKKNMKEKPIQTFYQISWVQNIRFSFIVLFELLNNNIEHRVKYVFLVPINISTFHFTPLKIFFRL